jgi:hypothetical protein
MMDRIIGALTFRSGIYAEVEGDTSWTGQAWVLVVIVLLLNQLGVNASPEVGLVGWLGGAIVGTIFAVIAFAVGAAVISWVGRSLFSADVNCEEVVRTVGLATVWRVIGFVGVLALVSVTLTCLLAPASIVAWILGIVAALIAVKEALDLEWGQTIVTIIISFIVQAIIMAIAGGILAAIGLGAGAALGLLGG